MATNKRKHAFWLTPEAKAMVEDAHADNCGGQSEFVEKAIRFYDGYLHTGTRSPAGGLRQPGGAVPQREACLFQKQRHPYRTVRAT